MATPLGHYLLGLSITQGMARNESERKRGIFLAAVANLPDLDLLPGLLGGSFWEFHRGFTHSFGAGIIAASLTLALVLLFRSDNPIRLMLVVLVVYMSHVLLDMLTHDTGRSLGVQLFWPWIKEPFQSPIVLLPGGRFGYESFFSPYNLLIVVREALIFLPLAALAYTLRATRLPWPRTAVWLYGGWFAAAVCASTFLI